MTWNMHLTSMSGCARGLTLVVAEQHNQTMKTITDRQAGADLSRLMKETAESHEPIQITGESESAVLISEQDWRSIEESLFLLSIPNMRESIIAGINTPISECSSDLPW